MNYDDFVKFFKEEYTEEERTLILLNYFANTAITCKEWYHDIFTHPQRIRLDCDFEFVLMPKGNIRLVAGDNLHCDVLYHDCRPVVETNYTDAIVGNIDAVASKKVDFKDCKRIQRGMMLLLYKWEFTSELKEEIERRKDIRKKVLDATQEFLFTDLQ